MSKSTRRPQQIFTIVMWLLSLIFAGFLIGFGSLVIRDLPTVDRSIEMEDFVDADALAQIEAREDSLGATLRQLGRDQEDAQLAYLKAQRDYSSAKQNFDNWIATRSATESSDQNPEVIARTRQLETLQAEVRSAEREVEDAGAAYIQAQRGVSENSEARAELFDTARPAYNRAMNWEEFRVFLKRLAITLPLLILAGWMATKKRESSYWPLYRGFVLFALFAFFVELVPYLPSYGGYVRFGVGIIMIVLLGHFIIRGMRRYMARKQAEEERSEVERRQSIEYETALKKIAAKTCPGCDRSIVTRDGIHTDFCVHCGIKLQTQCRSCGNRNVSFHKFCLSCGTPSEEVSGPQTA